MNRKPYILLTNDDGIGASGLSALVQTIRQFADVAVIAPLVEKSAVSNAITLTDPLRVRRTNEFPGLDSYSVNGTPVDCVKLAVRSLLDRRPDALISGINHGENTGVNIVYSGTVGAAAEGAIQGIPSFAVSLTGYIEPDFSTAAIFSAYLLKRILIERLPAGVFLNVNVPDCGPSEIKGVAVTAQGTARFEETFHKREDPRRAAYYWIAGKKEDFSSDSSLDESTVKENYISVTPLHCDYTDYRFLDTLKSWKLDCQLTMKEEKS